MTKKQSGYKPMWKEALEAFKQMTVIVGIFIIVVIFIVALDG